MKVLAPGPLPPLSANGYNTAELESQSTIARQQFITSDPNVCRGQLCAKGTRVLATNFLDSLAEGASRDEVLPHD